MKIVSNLILRIAILVLVAPTLPVTEEIAAIFHHVSDRIEQVRIVA